MALPLSPDGLCERRYFHFVIGEDPAAVSWPRLGTLMGIANLLPGRHSGEDLGDFTVEHRRLESSRTDARGAMLELASVRGDGEPPYRYDCVLVRATTGGSAFAAVGFPFSALARDLVSKYMERAGPGDPQLKRIAIPRVVEAAEQLDAPEGMAMKVLQMQLLVRGDFRASHLDIGGDDPLRAAFFQDVLKGRIGAGELLPQSCTLRWEDVRKPLEEGASRRATLHMDGFGNLRLYVGVGARNLVLFKPIIEWLASLEVFSSAVSNPLAHVVEKGE